jgi:hypothetical protein
MVVPAGLEATSSMSPWWLRRMRLAIDRPRPVPSGRPLRKLSKMLFAQRLGNAGAGVGHIDGRVGGVAAIHRGSGDDDRAAGGHRLGGVEEQVEQHLLDLALVGIDDERARRGREAEHDLALRQFQPDQDDGVVDHVRDRPARVQARRRLGEAEHAGDDGLELVEFFADHAHVGAARIASGKSSPR